MAAGVGNLRKSHDIIIVRFLVLVTTMVTMVDHRGGTNSSVFGDVREVRSSVFGQNHTFEHVRSSVLMILKKILAMKIHCNEKGNSSH